MRHRGFKAGWILVFFLKKTAPGSLTGKDDYISHSQINVITTSLSHFNK